MIWWKFPFYDFNLLFVAWSVGDKNGKKRTSEEEESEEFTFKRQSLRKNVIKIDYYYSLNNSLDYYLPTAVWNGQLLLLSIITQNIFFQQLLTTLWIYKSILLTTQKTSRSFHWPFPIWELKNLNLSIEIAIWTVWPRIKSILIHFTEGRDIIKTKMKEIFMLASFNAWYEQIK